MIADWYKKHGDHFLALSDHNVLSDHERWSPIVKNKGGELAGIVSAETANNIVLRLPGGAELPVLRGDIASQHATGRSLMPEGLETVLKPQDAADLLTVLRGR